jgi:hypothetical protein
VTPPVRRALAMRQAQRARAPLDASPTRPSGEHR